MFKVEVRSRIVGVTQPENTPSNVVLDLLNEELTVAELISHAVEEQIHDLLVTRRLDIEQAQRILNRQYLTNAEVKEQAEKGVVRKPSAQDASLPQVDPKTEVEKALRAFERKTYFIVVNGQQLDGLNEVVHLTSTSKVTFVRLTPLVGG